MNTENNQQEEYIVSQELYQQVDQSPKKKDHRILKNILFVILGIALGLAIMVAAVSTGLVRVQTSASSTIESLEKDSLDNGSTSKLATIISYIKSYYYQDVEDTDLVDGIYKGLVESLGDDYSAYYTQDEYQDLMTSVTGNYSGIGALLSQNKETGVVTITKVYSGTPAEEAGLKAEDIIEYADEYAAGEEDLDAFVQHIRGEEGTTVTLTILRGDVEMAIEVTRAKVSTPSVEYQMLDNNIGYIQISQFMENTADDFKAAYEDLESQGMTAVIFDLRNNGGGLLDSVNEIMDYLLPEGTIVYTMDKNGNRQDYNSDSEHHKDLPSAVLVNGYSASASEIFTGAVRDYEYGTIIGTQTFGKGIVQSTIPLSDGSALKLTTASYYTPNGECIHGVGITPDIELEYQFLGGEDDEYSIDLDNQIQKAIEVLNQQ